MRAPPCFLRPSASHALQYVLPVISRRLKTGIPVIHIFQRSWPNPSAEQFLHFLPFKNKPNLQRSRSSRTARLCKPHASKPGATKHTEPRLWEPEASELQGWFARLGWPSLPDASTRSWRSGLEAQLAARVTQKCWAERSVWSQCTSQGALGVPSGACSSIGLMAWPHMDPCLGPGRPWDWPPPHKCFQVTPQLCSFCRRHQQHRYLFHSELQFIPFLL